MTEVAFGTLKDESQFHFVDYRKVDGFWSFSLDEIRLGSHVFNSEGLPIEAVLVNSYT
jgi:hypothetical protein